MLLCVYIYNSAVQQLSLSASPHNSASCKCSDAVLLQVRMSTQKYEAPTDSNLVSTYIAAIYTCKYFLLCR